MQLNAFNELLKSLYNKYLSLKDLKQSLLTYSEQDILSTIISIDSSNKGWISHFDITNFNQCQHHTQSYSFTSQLSIVFPFEKISYSTILTHLLNSIKKYDPLSYESLQAHPKQTLSSVLIIKILKEEILLASSLPLLIQMLPLFIPHHGPIINKVNINEFLKSQNHFQMQSQQIVQMLNQGINSSQIIHRYVDEQRHQKKGHLKEQNKFNTKMIEFKNITNRLEQRLNAFGSEWFN